MADPDVKAQILEAEQLRQTAVVAIDLVALDQLFADDLVHVHSTGLVHSKEELLQHIDRKRGFLSIERGPLNVRVEGDVAVMTGPIVNRMRGKDGAGDIVMHGFVTQLLRRSPRGWQFTNFQLTLTAEGNR
jgi:ketosteroid isomerase-like protein